MSGDRVRELREVRCWSEAHLADATRLNVRTVQRIEAGEPCSYETMMGLAAALGVDVATLETSRGRKATAAVRLRLKEVYSWTDIYERRGGKWVAVASQNTPVK